MTERYLKKLEEKVAQYWKDRLRDPKEVQRLSNEHPLKEGLLLLIFRAPNT